MTDLSVLRGDVVVGRLSAGSAGAAVFRYHPAYLAAGEPRPISRSLPLSPAPTLTSWFGGLLPGAPVIAPGRSPSPRWTTTPPPARPTPGVPAASRCRGRSCPRR